MNLIPPHRASHVVSLPPRAARIVAQIRAAPLHTRGAWIGGALLLGFAASLAFAAATFAFDGAAPSAASLDAHVSEQPTMVPGVRWASEARGPGGMYRDALGRFSQLTSVMLWVGAVAGALGFLGYLSQVKEGERDQLRTRRSIGASRRGLLWQQSLEIFALASIGSCLGFAAAGSLLLPLLERQLAGGPLGSLVLTTDLRAAGFGFAVLAGWIALVIVLITTWQVSPGEPLHAKRNLALPSEGQPGVPGVAILQVAGMTALLVGAGALLTDAPAEFSGLDGDFSRTPGAHASSALLLDLDFASPQLISPEGGEEVARLAAALLAHERVELLSLTSPGFWEGTGVVQLAVSECGRCFDAGIPRPLRGEPAVHHFVSPDTFAHAGIGLIEGRAFTSADDSSAEGVAVVSRSYAARNFEGGSALGRSVRIGNDEAGWHVVVGVVEERPRSSPAAREVPRGEVYVPVFQRSPRNLELAVAGPVRAEELESLLSPFPTIQVREMGSVGDRLEGLFDESRRFAQIWLALAFAAVIVAMIGVMLTVSRRVRDERIEIGIHRAVGARPSRIAARSLLFGLRVGAVGATVGAWSGSLIIAALAPEMLMDPGQLGRIFLLPIALALVASTSAALYPAMVAARMRPSEAILG